MHRLIYGPFQPVCFKRDLAYTLTLTRFFTGPFYHALLLKYTRFHSHAIPYIGMCQCVMPRMYMFMTPVSFSCWGCVQWSWSRRCELNTTYMNYMHFMLWRPDSYVAWCISECWWCAEKCACARHFRLIHVIWCICVCDMLKCMLVQDISRGFMNHWMFVTCSKKMCMRARDFQWVALIDASQCTEKLVSMSKISQTNSRYLRNECMFVTCW